MLDLSRAEFRHEPYQIGLARYVLPPPVYQTMLAAWPPLDLFKKFEGRSCKYSLSEVNNKPAYKDFVLSSFVWRPWHDYIKSRQFVLDVVGTLAMHGVNVPINGKSVSCRWEFAAMPANGGYLKPHTDIASKVITLVIPIVGVGEWDQSWCGGTDVLVPKEGQTPPQDYEAPLEAFDRVHTYPYLPNQAVIFVKTDNSWHSVGPIQGPAGVFRRTLTVNIEDVEKLK